MKNAFIIMTTEIEFKISKTHEMLIAYHNEILDTKVIGYKEIIAALKNVRITDSKIRLPIDLENPSSEVLRKLLTFGVLQGQETIIIVFFMPTIDLEKYLIFKLYSIPVIENKMATYIDLNDELMVTDTHYEKFAKIDSIKKCKKANQEYFCDGINVLNKNHEACELQALSGNKRHLEKICDMKVMKLERLMVIKTEKKNRFLTFAPAEEFGKLVRANGVQQMIFEGTQILEINEEAKLYLEGITIKFVEDNLKQECIFRIGSNFCGTLP